MIPSVDIDLYSADNVADPYPAYRKIRDAGPVCRLGDSEFLAIGRHATLRTVLADWETFSSGSGVAMNPAMNAALQGTILSSDPPEHKRLREIIGKPLTPAELAGLRDIVSGAAKEIVERLVARGSFDVASELATYLPVTVVSKLVGLPESGRERMLDWASAAFNAMAPQSAGKFEESMPILGEMLGYLSDPDLPRNLVPGSWAARLYGAVEAGEISREFFQSLVQAYVAPSLDTTIFATTNLFWLFGHNPDQWQLLREKPALIPRAINEALRMRSPATGFSRITTRDTDIDGVEVPEGSRVIMLFASGNRDERRYVNPDRFDILRDSADHLAFGHSLHRCVGMNLALLEMRSLLEAFLPLVTGFRLGYERRASNVVLSGFSQLMIEIH